MDSYTVEKKTVIKPGKREKQENDKKDNWTIKDTIFIDYITLHWGLRWPK